MSRKWERMVYRNAKALSRKRKKQGLPGWTAGGGTEIVKGRSLMLPIMLTCVSLFFLFTVSPSEVDLYWFTVIAYFVLALMYFFILRPYLKIDASELAVRRWFSEQRVPASSIREIQSMPGYIVVEFDWKGKSSRWVFSRMLNLYPIPDMAERLRRFAERNRVRFTESGKSDKTGD